MTEPGSILDPNTRLATQNFPLMPDESPELFEEVRSQYMSTLRPANAVGERIADDIISAHWEITRQELRRCTGGRGGSCLTLNSGSQRPRSQSRT